MGQLLSLTHTSCMSQQWNAFVHGVGKRTAPVADCSRFAAT